MSSRVAPGIIIGATSLVVLAIALFALYSKKLAGRWRTVYVVTAVMAQFFNVLVVQSFMKIPALHAMPPAGEESIVKITQLCPLVLFIVLGIAAGKKFHRRLRRLNLPRGSRAPALECGQDWEARVSVARNVRFRKRILQADLTLHCADDALSVFRSSVQVIPWGRRSRGGRGLCNPYLPFPL